MKKFKLLLILSILLCAILALCITANAEVYSGYCGGDGDGTNLTWTLDTSTGVLEIDGAGIMDSYEFDYVMYLFYEPPWYSYKSSVKSVTLGDDVTSIGECAFYNCSSLTNLNISNAASIGYDALSGCYSIKSITANDTNTKYSSDEYGVLFDKNKTTLIQYPVGNSRSSYSVPATVTSIGKYAFEYCDALTSVYMPSVTSIGWSAFYGCESLTSVDMPNVTSIDQYAFKSCTSLTSVEIPASTASISYKAFHNCLNLEKATVYSKTATLGIDVFENTSADFEIHGYTGSTAETYANNYNHKFVPLDEAFTHGDADGNGVLEIFDVLTALKKVLDNESIDADINLDGVVNLLDIMSLLKALIKLS